MNEKREVMKQKINSGKKNEKSKKVDKASTEE
jgi:hypothetical protein